MKFSLINPRWSFEGSIYFGCREPHLPLEYGYARALLEREGHEVQLIDAQMEELSPSQLRARVSDFDPDFAVVTTAPSYLFWRCAPPELRVPRETIGTVRDCTRAIVVVGPHGSTTPTTTLQKLAADVVVMGECEEILPKLAGDWAGANSVCYRRDGAVRIHGGPHAADMKDLPALRWDRNFLARHAHHHHRFDAKPTAPGAEMETSRGCPYHCTFCAKDNFRNSFRRRPLNVIAEELDSLIEAGIEYVYLIDEIFLAYRDVVEVIAARSVKFGIQTRIDLWNYEMIDLLGRAGCVSIEAGVESITEAGRNRLDKKCKLSTDELADRLIYAKSRVPFVQANLLESQDDNPREVEAFRQRLQKFGVWSNAPVPLFPYPGSPDYTRLWGNPDERAWERAHEHYLKSFREFSDIQEQQPAPLVELERGR
ncbi:MAG TPA: TIGR04295 family B12-binding domain-containing radical SAM protein [Bryobacteraceae bacterium]|nr:TIGR04295 family B12-binding domain-containing radical SAM protein [Bryobacteraceae bacterium]